MNFLNLFEIADLTQQAEVPAVEVIAVRSDGSHHCLLRPNDVDIFLRYMQDNGFVCGTTDVTVTPEELEHYAIDLSQL